MSEIWEGASAPVAQVEDLILSDEMRSMGLRLVMIPQLEGEALHRMQGWRGIIEEEGQDLWCMYHWIVAGQGGKTTGIYRLADWLKRFNVPDKTSGAHWLHEIPASTTADSCRPPKSSPVPVSASSVEARTGSA